MMTTKEFKQLHALTDKAFRALRDDILTAYPDLTLGHLMTRRGSTSWEMLRLDLWNEALSRRNSAPIDDLVSDLESPVPVAETEVLAPLPLFSRELPSISQRYALTSKSDLTAMVARVEDTGLTIEKLGQLVAHFDRYCDTQVMGQLETLKHAEAQRDGAEMLVAQLKAKLKVAAQQQMTLKAETEAVEAVTQAKKSEAIELAELLRSLQS